MKLIFLYGPPGVGKLTIAKELAAMTGLPLADNESLVAPIANIFGWEHPERKRLGDEFRLELFRTAAAAGKSFITTFGGGGAKYDPFIHDAMKAVRDAGGEVLFVRCTAPIAVIASRVGDRVGTKGIDSPERFAELLARTPDIMERARVATHLELDTSVLTPSESAVRVVDYYRIEKVC